MGAIEVEVGGRDDAARTVRLYGTWLVQPDEDETRTTEAGYDAGSYYGVARTKRGQIEVYCTHVNDDSHAVLDTYPSLDAAEGAGWPKHILAEARREVDPDYVEEWDI